MDLREMEIFVCVMETGSFSRAAERLKLSQPTVSARISALERALKVRLIFRTTKELRPTEAGRLFYWRARQILALRDDALRELQAVSTEVRGIVAVAASSVPAHYLLPELLRSFREKFPDIAFDVQTTDSQEAVDRVSSRQVEIGFCGTLIRSPKCVFRELASDQLLVITPNTAQFRQYRATGFPVRRIESERLICREKGSGTRKETELFLRAMGVDPARLEIAVEVRSSAQIQQLVSAGQGIAVLSRSALDTEKYDLLSFDFDNTKLRRKLYMLRCRNADLSPAARTFFSFAEEYCRRRR
ncbi:MAG: LysR family transcriptional regulator [Oscillibacter sp.]|jgi:DNA-binding transcriptional LysR family regulator|nr:LysR family transcriptional regulator [Oscillibacter sp.]